MRGSAQTDYFIELPYVLRHTSGRSYWEETGDCAPSEWSSNKQMVNIKEMRYIRYVPLAKELCQKLHFAATARGQKAHEFQSVGGIFTRVCAYDCG